MTDTSRRILPFKSPDNSVRLGLLGVPHCGKSTLFNCLTQSSVRTNESAFSTTVCHRAPIRISEPRLEFIRGVFSHCRVIGRTTQVVDTPGLARNARYGEGVGAGFLEELGETHGFFCVCGGFLKRYNDEECSDIDPVQSLKVVNEELLAWDLAAVEARIAHVEQKLCQTFKKKNARAEFYCLEKVKSTLEDGIPIRLSEWSTEEWAIIDSHGFLTAKPMCYLVNMSEKDFVRQKNKWLPKIAEWVKDNGGGPILPFSAEFEQKLVEMESDADRKAYIEQVGAKKSMLDKIVTTGYEFLDLIHFFACGEDGVRCWTIQKGAKAPQAAGVIHNDFERGFICAEVYKYEDIRELGSEAAVKAAGKLIQQGKNYEVHDGDIVKFVVVGKPR